MYSQFGPSKFKALDDKYGFRDLKFETPATSIKSLKRIAMQAEYYKSFPNSFGCTKTDEDLTISEFKLESIEYWFYKSLLCTFTINVSTDYDNVDGILKVLETAYGSNEKKEFVGEINKKYTWSGNKVYMNYDILINHSGKIISATITISSNKLSNLESNDMNQKEDNSIQNAAKKL